MTAYSCERINTGILHLGQVQFDTKSDLSGDSGVIVDAAPLAQAARLLGVEQGDLEGALVKKKSLVIRGEGTALYVV